MRAYYSTSFLVFILFALFACHKDSELNEKSPQKEFLQNIVSQITEIKVDAVAKLNVESMYQPTWVTPIDSCTKLIVGDPFDQTISLIDTSGNELFRVGGEGRGPGEFQGMIDLHIGANNRLYVLDGMHYRVSIYDINGDELDYREAISFKNHPLQFLYAIYVTDNGHFGVYEESEGFFTKENKYHLYRLDSDFNPEEFLLELPGNGRRKIETDGLTFYMPYKYLGHTIWSFTNDWFYYVHTMEPIVHGYNLKTGKQTNITIPHLKTRKNSPDFIEAVKRYEPAEDDSWPGLEEIDNLPLLDGLVVNRNDIYATTLPTPGLKGMTLIVDVESGETSYFRTPKQFFPRKICGNRVYGIDFKDEGEYKIMELKLHRN